MMEDLYVNHWKLLNRLPPCLRKNICNLCANGKIGLLPISIADISIVNRPIPPDMAQFDYHIKIKIPYGGKHLTWELVFNPNDFKFAPDFLFHDESFPPYQDIDIIANEIPSLANWDVESSTSLESVLREFIILYKNTQMEELHSNNIYSRMLTEYNLLMTCEEEGITSDDVEIIIDGSGAHFFISIKVETSNLPEYAQNLFDKGILINPQYDFANLLVSFMRLDASRVNVHLQLSPRLEQMLGSSKMLHIPQYCKETSLVEYVPLISRILDDHVKEVVHHFQLKKEFITCLLNIRCYSIIECDTTTFTGAAFLCEENNYYSVVHITLGKQFPKQKPIVKLKSLYCTNPKSKLPCEEIVQYVHRENNKPDDMIRTLLTYIKDAIPSFKIHNHLKV